MIGPTLPTTPCRGGRTRRNDDDASPFDRQRQGIGKHRATARAYHRPDSLRLAGQSSPPTAAMVFGFGNALYVSLLLINALAILNEERFLQRSALASLG